MIIFCAGQLVYSSMSTLGTVGIRNVYRFTKGKKDYLTITPSIHERLVFQMKGMNESSILNSLLYPQVLLLLLGLLVCLFGSIYSQINALHYIPFAVGQVTQGFEPGLFFLICRIVTMFVSCMIVSDLMQYSFSGSGKIKIEDIELDEIVNTYSVYYTQNMVPLDKILDLIGLYISHNPQVQYLGLSIISLVTALLISVFFIIFKLNSKTTNDFDENIIGLNAKFLSKNLREPVNIIIRLAIFTVSIILAIGIAYYIPISNQTYSRKDFSKTYTNAAEIISSEMVNMSSLKTKNIGGFDVRNFTDENSIHISEINKSTKTKLQESFFNNWFVVFIIMTRKFVSAVSGYGAFLLGILILSINEMIRQQVDNGSDRDVVENEVFIVDLSLRKIKILIYIILFFFILLNGFIEFLANYEKTLSFIVALQSSLFTVSLYLIGVTLTINNENIERYYQWIIFVIMWLIIFASLYNIRLKNLEKRNFVEYIDGEFKKLDAKAIPMVNKDVEDIGEIEFITFDLKEGVKVGERVLINPCSIEIDMKNSIFRIKQNGEYLVPNNICKNELDRILLDKFAKGEIDWSKQFEGMELDGYDIQTVQEYGERIRRILTCSSIVLRGESGCGKTTLMNIISGLHNGYYDCITVFGSNGRSVNYRNLDLDKFNQMRTVIPQSTMRMSFVPISLDLARSLWECSEEEFFELAERLGLTIPLNLPEGKHEKLMSYLSYLSGGESARLSIFHVLMMLMSNKSNLAPTLLLADEPTSALDNLTGKKVMNLIREDTYGINISVMHNLSSISDMEYTEYEIANGLIRVRYNF